MRFSLALFALLYASSANAACEFVDGGCTRDRSGNTYRTEENSSGGYTTYRNGSAYSNTQQNSYGNWEEKSRSGTTLRRYGGDDPFAPKF